MEKIIIRGARQHNLKNLNLEIPKDKLVVITGLSGSGKSSLAFDTIYAEGQRRYVESLSAYARQFLELMEKPDVELIEGLSPAIAIEQRPPSHNPRSIVGTVTEIYDYLRLFFARIGIPHCPNCGHRITRISSSEIVKIVNAYPTGTSVHILSPIVRGRIGTYEEVFNRLKKSGYVKVVVDGKIFSLDEKIKLSRYQKHFISILIDRVVVGETEKSRISDSIETALKESDGIVEIAFPDGAPESVEGYADTSSTPLSPGRKKISVKKKARKSDGYPSSVIYSQKNSCVECGFSLGGEIEPRLFSFNSPFGACPECSGLGEKVEIDESLVVPDPSRSIRDGVIQPWSEPVTTRTHRWKGAWRGYYNEILEDVSNRNGIPMDIPWLRLKKEHKDIILYGDGIFEGVINNLTRRFRETESEFVKEEIQKKYMRTKICPACDGRRLKKEALSVLVGGKNIAEVSSFSVAGMKDFFDALSLTETEKTIARNVLKEIKARLEFLSNVGLDYLTIDRKTQTLAGGEAQRISLATQIGSRLTGVLYVLDEPSIGLHQRDNEKLLATLKELRDLGNTLIVVEHDEDTIRSADWIIDLGPGAGAHGGEVVAEGTLDKILKSEKSLTAKYLKGELKIPVPASRRKQREFVEIIGARQFNLKNIMSFEKITIPAPAKINIFLEVTSRRPDGYHNISTVFCLTALSDEIVIEKIQRGNGRVDFHCDIKELDTQENLVVKAAEKILNYTTDKTCGLKITLRKKIPWGAGLGGGSSDAASTLKGVRNLLRVKISDEELLKIGTSLGADVPFFIKSYLCARADGIGEKIKQLPPFWLQEEEPLTLLIVKPPFEIPTKEAYSRIRFPLTAPREIDRITKAIKSGKKFSKSIAPLVFNRFEEVLDRKSATVISRIKKVLIANGAAAALMSGSGSAVVGFFTKNSRVSTLKVAAFFKKSPGLSEKIFITNFAS